MPITLERLQNLTHQNWNKQVTSMLIQIGTASQQQIQHIQSILDGYPVGSLCRVNLTQAVSIRKTKMPLFIQVKKERLKFVDQEIGYYSRGKFLLIFASFLLLALMLAGVNSGKYTKQITTTYEGTTNGTVTSTTVKEYTESLTLTQLIPEFIIVVIIIVINLWAYGLHGYSGFRGKAGQALVDFKQEKVQIEGQLMIPSELFNDLL